MQVVGGPLGSDIDAIKEACDGLGTHEVRSKFQDPCRRYRFLISNTCIL